MWVSGGGWRVLAEVKLENLFDSKEDKSDFLELEKLGDIAHDLSNLLDLLVGRRV